MAQTDPIFWQMWPVLLGLIGAAVLYSWERWSMEVVSAGITVALVVFFYAFPLADASVNPSAGSLLAGYANPALITILALLIVGQGMFHTSAIEGPASAISEMVRERPVMVFAVGITIVFIVSAFLNNTPLVVMFIPFVAAMMQKLGASPSRAMMHLSFICILAGMTTLIGSSTNLLVSDALLRYTGSGLDFFELTPMGLMLAVPGILYIVFVLNRLLPDRGNNDEADAGGSGRQFVAQLDITPSHPLHGAEPKAGMFTELSNMTVRVIKRGTRTILPPFSDIALKSDDSLVVATTRKNLMDFLKSHPEYINEAFRRQAGIDADTTDLGGLVGFEAVVAPGSRLIGRTIAQTGLLLDPELLLLGVQRRTQMIRSSLQDIRLDAGDTLLLLAPRDKLRQISAQRDLLPLFTSLKDIPDVRKAGIARAIFLSVIGLSALGILPILHASLLGAVSMIVTGCLNRRQALRAIDTRIFFLIGSALALGVAMETTGAALFLANLVTTTFLPLGPVVLLSALFLQVAILTNVMSNSATAILFAPVALNVAAQASIDPAALVMTVIFAANCSFATPIAYQTNLLVMGPGRYRFLDFVRGGGPLVILIWLVFTLIAPHYFGL